MEEPLADDVPELQFRPDALGAAVADRQLPLSVEELDPHIIALDPFAGLLKMREERARGGLRNLIFEQRHLRLALHVRLPRQDEHLDGLRRVGSQE